MIYIFHFLFLFEIQSFKIDNMFLLISVLITFFSFYLEYKIFFSFNVPEYFLGFTCISTSVLIAWCLYDCEVPTFLWWEAEFLFLPVCGVFHSLFQNSSSLIVVVAQIWLRFLVSSVGATFNLFLCLYKYFNMVIGKDKSST